MTFKKFVLALKKQRSAGWRLTRLDRFGPSGMIRCANKCPIERVAGVNRGDYEIGAEMLKLSTRLADKIVSAADNDASGYAPAYMRREMLKALGLKK